jgi:outer membrane lipoprotein LolB
MIKNIAKTQSYCLKNGVYIILALFALNGCVSQPKLENEQAISLNNNLVELQRWKIKGKIAWISPTERKSAYMNWHQNNAQIQFDLSNLLGINLASLDYDGKLATLDANDQTFRDSSPSLVIYQATGWQMPIKQLSTWIKGTASDAGRDANGNSSKVEIERYENGLVSQIIPKCQQCEQWSIKYDTYESVKLSEQDYQLPTQITMVNDALQATIKIRISEWSQ